MLSISTVGPNAPGIVTSRPAAAIARKKPAATRLLPTLSLYQSNDTWLLGRFDTEWMRSGLAYSGIIYVVLGWLVKPALNNFYSALGTDPFYCEDFASLTYVFLCLIAGFGLGLFKNRKKKSGVASAPPGGGTPKLPHP